ncbi:1-aminocyclopropane-1-carboxylate deaminase/D-cysteine desulfhydrase [Tenacibaculum aestuariivivum]|uniref:1-aminocyclopropane-1-carboxylate deaminase/D-cysteine desulfhydrase n=1 Tax=Tenacibaculum aestuariivivum TaxID=2006131 RepID=UPI003AB16F6F
MMFKKVDSLTNNLRIFRDDLYPFLGGGNKGRKMEAIAKDIFSKKAKALVTTGGIQSNHCRAVSVFAAENKMDCTLVLHGSKEEFGKQSGNAKIMRLSGADIVFVDEASQIGSMMDIAMEQYKEKKSKPYYIWGGGHTLEGGLSYIKVVKELKQYCEKNNWFPKYIFHASGTGSTQSGLLAGLDKYGFNTTKVVGISVARNSNQATEIVSKFYEKLCQNYNINCTNKEIIVLDNYLMGGYEKYNSELKKLCINSIKDYGFTLDTCYTGKAFYGMLDYIKKNNINDNDILFWHTGGIFNFLAE